MHERLKFRVHLLRHDVDRKMEDLWSDIARRLPLGLRRAVIADAVVRATQPTIIGPDAYAGPDGLEYKHLWEAAAYEHVCA